MDRDLNPARTPLVTIAIPTFNRATLLKACVTAALSQTYGNFEVVVSDNASTDDTSEVLSAFSDTRLRVIRQDTNIGLLPNWNACLAAAKGEYFILIPDDDTAAPWLVERCISVTQGHHELPIVVALSNYCLDPFGGALPAYTSGSLETGVWDGMQVFMEYLTDRVSVTMCSVMLHTESLRARKGFPLDYPHTADVAAWAPLLFLGKAGFVNEACATFYEHNQSETARLGVERLLRDGWKVETLLSQVAEQYINDPSQRLDIQTQIRRCFARRGLKALSYERHNGGSILMLLRFAWRFRRELNDVSMKDILRFGAVLLCPRPISNRIRRLKQTALKVPASEQTSRDHGIAQSMPL